jgi:phage-related protein
MQSTNIYNIRKWKAGTEYLVNDVVWYRISSGGVDVKFYWYATANHEASVEPSISNSQWAGVQYDGKTSRNKPHWFWKPSYNLTINSAPKVITHQFGDGYEQRTIDGVNNLLLAGSVNFETRDAKETKAMAHFLNQRKGQESFIMMLPPPYNLDKLYIAKDWTTTFNFYDNYSVRINLREVTS